jgi:quercetin dioxygenase-like cupin family protein
MTTGHDGYILQPGEGKILQIPTGGQIAYMATGVRSPAGPSVLEFQTLPAATMSPHIHRTIEELFYVVSGEFELRIGERMFRAGPGSFAAVPPGVAHGYRNSGTAPATFLAIISPGGVFDHYFEELAEIGAKPGPRDVAAVAELRRRYDTEDLTPLPA